MADDDHRFRRVLRELIEATPGFTLLGEAASGEHTPGPVALLRPDLVLLDVRMPGIGGVEVARTLVGRHPGLTVALMSADGLPPPSGIATEGRRVIFVRKEDLCPDVLLDLWRGRRTRSGPNWVAVRLGESQAGADQSKTRP